MFCPNCGNENRDGSKACAFCGRPLEQRTGAGTGKRRKKGKKGLAVTLICLAVVLAGAGVFAATNFALCANFFLRTFASPAKYYQFVEARNVSLVSGNVSELLSGRKREAPEPENIQLRSSMDLRLDDGARELLGGVLESWGYESDLNVSWLEALALDSEINRLDEMLSASCTLRLNEKEIAAATGTLDIDGEKLWLRVPQISDSDMELDASPVFEAIEYETGMSFRELVDDFSGGYAAELDAAQVQKVLTRYLTMISENLGSIKKDRDKLTAESVTATYTTLTVTVKERELQKLVQKVSAELQKDKDVRAIIGDLEDAMDLDDLYDRFLEKLEQIEDHAEDIELENNIVMKLWIDNRGIIRGRRLKSGDTELLCAAPVKNGKYGFEASAVAPDAEYFLTGSGKADRDTLDGEFTLEFNGREYLTLDLRSADLAGLRQNKLSGELNLTLLRDFYSDMGIESSRARSLEKLSIGLVIEADAAQSDLRVSLVGDGDKEYAALDCAGELGEAGTIRSVKNAVQPDEWIGGITDEVVADNMQNLRGAGVPDWIVNSLEESITLALNYYRWWY